MIRSAASAMAIALLGAVAASSVEAEDCMLSLGAAPAGSPRFEDHSVSGPPVAKPAPLDLKSPAAKRYRTRLREGAAAGPNFAVHYTVVEWGCGAGCVQWAIVDAATGTVFFPPEKSVGAERVGPEPSDPDHDFEPLRFRRDSDLLIVLGAPGEDEKREGIAWLRWTGKALERLAFVPYDKVCPGVPR